MRGRDGINEQRGARRALSSPRLRWGFLRITVPGRARRETPLLPPCHTGVPAQRPRAWERFLCCSCPPLGDMLRRAPSSFRARGRRALVCVLFTTFVSQLNVPGCIWGVRFWRPTHFPKLRSRQEFWVQVQNWLGAPMESSFSALVC